MATYNIDDYGAPVDNVSSANTYIMTAASKANAAGGGVVLIPNRVYITSDLDLTLYSNVVYVGSGRGSVLKMDATTTPTNAFIIKVGANCRVTGLGFDPNSVANSTCVRVSNESNVEIDHCHFTSPRSGGVYIEGTSAHINIHHCTSSGSGYFFLTASDAAITHLQISDNHLSGGSDRGDGIEINVPSGSCSYFVISGNKMDSFTAASAAGIGIGIAGGTYGTITGNQLYNCREGIHLENNVRGITVVGNEIVNMVARGITVNSNVTGTVRDIVIADNHVSDCFTTIASNTGGIAIEGSKAKSGVTITGNVVEGCGAPGIHADGQSGGECSYVVIAHNVCKNNTGPGIQATRLTEALIQGNICYDDNSGSQTYGLELKNAQSSTRVYDNNMNGNATAGALETNLSGTYTYNRNDGITDGP